jgi:hypothetical protein
MSADRVQDTKEIEQVLYLYAWMVDQRKWELQDQVFADGATIDYTSTGGVKGPSRPTLEWLHRGLSGWPINLHFITNITIEFTPTGATARCLFFAPMGRALPGTKGELGSQEIINNAGYYFDKLVKTPKGWRITERICNQTIMMGSLPPGYEIPK